jgi:hypothetical protein
MPVFNYPDYHINSIRNAVCSNPVATSAAAANCAASDPVLTFPRIRNNSAYARDIDEVRNTLEGMTSNAVFGDLAVMRDRYFSLRDRYHADILRRLKDDYRKWEVERIKKLISSKATIRYIMEVK